MIHNKKILAVVPARGGSKGIPLKNIQPIHSVPLVAIVGHLVRDLPIIDRSIVSSDHDEIIKIAVESGLDAPFKRPEHLSGSQIGDWDVLTHALQEMEKMDGCQYDLIVMLQPTSPMRTKEQIQAAIDKLIIGQYDSIWTVSETDSKHHPLKQLQLVGEQMEYYDDNGKEIIARQQLEQLYHRNGVAYVITRECLLVQKTIKGKKSGALIIKEPTVNIDTWQDLRLAEYMMK